MNHHTPTTTDLPEWSEWVAQDADGTWWAYEANPTSMTSAGTKTRSVEFSVCGRTLQIQRGKTVYGACVHRTGLTLGDYKKDLGDNLGVAPMPEGPGGKASPLNGIDGFYVNPNSKNAEGAVNLALFLTSQESSQIYTDKAGHVAIRSDVQAATRWWVRSPWLRPPASRRPQSVEFGQFWGPFGDAWTKAIEGVSIPVDAVKAACETMNKATGK